MSQPLLGDASHNSVMYNGKETFSTSLAHRSIDTGPLTPHISNVKQRLLKQEEEYKERLLDELQLKERKRQKNVEKEKEIRDSIKQH